MNIRIEGNEIKIYCYKCNKDIEVSDLISRYDSGLHCKYCFAHLGFLVDLPEWAKGFVIK